MSPKPSKVSPKPKAQSPKPSEGWTGWDEYAPFYDWENAQTLGRRDVPFWRQVALEARGRVLELGCGTGRISIPIARAGVPLVGVDRSAPMLERARAGRRRYRLGRLSLVRADIRALPFEPGSFDTVIAPYGVLQSLLADRDVRKTLASVSRVLAPGGTFGLDLVPDVPKWREYTNRIQLRGPAAGGTHLTLIESVRQDPVRRLTTFEQRYVTRRKGQTTEQQFELTFRTLSVPQMAGRLERAGFEVGRVLGDYRGRAWDERADVWIVLAKKR
jgi:ubiquinone/menaquinone biosynthesis C-methylase UbiE